MLGTAYRNIIRRKQSSLMMFLYSDEGSESSIIANDSAVLVSFVILRILKIGDFSFQSSVPYAFRHKIYDHHTKIQTRFQLSKITKDLGYLNKVILRRFAYFNFSAIQVKGKTIYL